MTFGARLSGPSLSICPPRHPRPSVLNLRVCSIVNDFLSSFKMSNALSSSFDFAKCVLE